ncbi:hypothetical protein [Myceligenerans pegani]|uniref:Uncharacterized protein n=1 Tax=Myceligenerans pegani TaxID=2776917 RepID=A0ABR9N7D8_9MICO|nr:hypothetical protein [Myceligenerans sp. TRM 65318]MBE1878962.1 hypothetical protein [Myceligenerans sp. TRM 65318]MBE3021233.1 hypothetical protein [Myceligenerans sp. TRM 65318]
MTTTEYLTLRRSIEQLRRSVAEVRDTFGDGPQVRRLVNDLERLEIDAGELAAARPEHPAGTETRDTIYVPDTPEDSTMWSDVDEEGLGGYHGDRS